MSEPNGTKQIELNGGTVKVVIPKQELDIDVELLALPDIETMPPNPIGFHPFRLLINIIMVESENRNHEVRVFNPPIEIHVQYTQEDMDLAKAVRRELQLGYWDGTRWSRFTETKHKFTLIPNDSPEGGGWGVVVISKWDDPTKAWGT